MIAQELKSKDRADDVAEAIVKTVELQRKSGVRRAVFAPVLSAAVSLIVGVVGLLIVDRLFPGRGAGSFPIAYFLITGRTARQEADALNAMSEHSERMKEMWERPHCRQRNPDAIYTREACGHRLLWRRTDPKITELSARAAHGPHDISVQLTRVGLAVGGERFLLGAIWEGSEIETVGRLTSSFCFAPNSGHLFQLRSAETPRLNITGQIEYPSDISTRGG